MRETSSFDDYEMWGANMPGYELIGKEEFSEIKDIFENANGVFFRQGFDQIRNGIFKVRDFEQKFADYLGVKHALAVTSGTAALKVALEALQFEKGAEVITQAFTFVATAEAIIEAGATPVICDIDQTLNLDSKALESLITPKTKAVIVVHMLGVPADMDAISVICKKHNLTLIEDTAWGLGGNYKGKKLGSIGDIGTFSFDYAKAITTGEGGMVVTNNDKIDFKARAYHDHGHENNPSVARWEDTRHSSGFNYRMNEMQGAVGLAQLKKLDGIIAKQRELKNQIAETILPFEGLLLRPMPAGSEESADALVFMVKDRKTALACREELLKQGLGTKILPEAVTWHFAKTWTHMESLVRRNGNLDSAFSISEELLSRSVALPINLKMDVRDVCTKVTNALKNVF